MNHVLLHVTAATGRADKESTWNKSKWTAAQIQLCGPLVPHMEKKLKVKKFKSWSFCNGNFSSEWNKIQNFQIIFFWP